MKINKMSKNKEVTVVIPQERKTAQDWMPLKDILNGFAYTKDNMVIGYLMIEPYNLELLSDKEKEKFLERFSETLNGEDDSFMWYCTEREADLNSYLDDLRYKADTSNSTKRVLLERYANTARNQVIGGELVEKKFYMGIRAINQKGVEAVLAQKLMNLKSAFDGIKIFTKITDDKMVYELYSNFSDPSSNLFDSGNYNDGLFTILK